MAPSLLTLFLDLRGDPGVRHDHHRARHVLHQLRRGDREGPRRGPRPAARAGGHGPVRQRAADLPADHPAAGGARHRGAALLAFSLSFDDFIITNFMRGNVNTFPMFVWGSAAARHPGPGVRHRVGRCSCCRCCIVLVAELVAGAGAPDRVLRLEAGVVDAAVAGLAAAARRRGPRCTATTAPTWWWSAAGSPGCGPRCCAKERDPAGRRAARGRPAAAGRRRGRNGGFCAAQPDPRARPTASSAGPMRCRRWCGWAARTSTAIARRSPATGIDCGCGAAASSTSPTEPWQVEGLRRGPRAGAAARRRRPAARRRRRSARRSARPPTSAALLDADGAALVDPARLVWGLAERRRARGGRVLRVDTACSTCRAGRRRGRRPHAARRACARAAGGARRPARSPRRCAASGRYVVPV